MSEISKSDLDVFVKRSLNECRFIYGDFMKKRSVYVLIKMMARN
jgi:hypothetical protein